jgi:CHRD domain-containing protein
MARWRTRKSMVAVAFAVIALLLYANPVAAQHEVKITIPLTAVDPVTGEATGDPDGTGKAEFELIPEHGQICYEIEVQGIAQPTEPAPGLGSAHIHFVATGGIAVGLNADFEPKGDDEFKATGCVDVNAALLNDIIKNPENYYVNIHNVDFPGGALAGVL